MLLNLNLFIKFKLETNLKLHQDFRYKLNFEGSQAQVIYNHDFKCPFEQNLLILLSC